MPRKKTNLTYNVKNKDILTRADIFIKEKWEPKGSNKSKVGLAIKLIQLVTNCIYSFLSTDDIGICKCNFTSCR